MCPLQERKRGSRNGGSPNDGREILFPASYNPTYKFCVSRSHYDWVPTASTCPNALATSRMYVRSRLFVFISIVSLIPLHWPKLYKTYSPPPKGLQQISLRICDCSTAPLLLLYRGLFACTPVLPTLAVDLNVLDFVKHLFVRLPPNVTGWCEGVEAFLEARNYKLETKVCYSIYS